MARLAFHASASYSDHDKSGGSNGGLIRFENGQLKWTGNAGLKTAIDALEPIKQKFPALSYADLYTLAGAVAIEEMGGPKINWRPGRVDATDPAQGPTEDNKLPDGAKGSNHLREVFHRLGFSDQELVALSGAHALGRCHRDRSGFEGPWTRAPTTFSNEYFKVLLNERWTPRKWKGPFQYENSTKDLMMLPSDIALLQDPTFRRYVEQYASNEELFFTDFARAYSKLLELGVPFPSDSKPWYRRFF